MPCHHTVATIAPPDSPPARCVAPRSEGAESLPGLLPHHLPELRKSGLTDATIVAAGIYSEANYDRLAALLGWRKLPDRKSVV